MSYSGRSLRLNVGICCRDLTHLIDSIVATISALDVARQLILDDWGITPLTADQRRDLLEIVDDRHGRASTVVTSQLPVAHWHEHIGN